MSILGAAGEGSNNLLVDGSNSMLNNLNLNNNKIINLANPTNNQDATSKLYCDTNSLLVESNCLLINGTNSMEADMDLNSHKIINLADPSNTQDAATKNYIDTKYNGSNIFIGNASGSAVTTGTDNVGIGTGSLSANTIATRNIAIGINALTTNTLSNQNIAIGNSALLAYNGPAANTNNVVIGNSSLTALTSGINNVAVGSLSATTLTSGSNNIIIGQNAGSAYTGSESNNILIGNTGATTDSGVCRIGGATTTSMVLAGVRGKTVGSGLPVYIGAASQLGTATSSRRFKENIVNAKVYDISKFRVVNFNYIGDDTSPQVGLIAEEVEELYPELVVYDDNQPYTVRYMDLIPILLQKIQLLESNIYGRLQNQQSEGDNGIFPPGDSEARSLTTQVEAMQEHIVCDP